MDAMRGARRWRWLTPASASSLVGGVVAVASGVALATYPFAAIALGTLAALCWLAVATGPRGVLPLVATALMATFATLPASIPRSIVVAERSLSVAEPLMGLTAVIVCLRLRPRFAVLPPLAYAAALVCAVITGQFNGGDVFAIYKELQGPAGMGAAFLVAVAMSSAGLTRHLLRLLGAVLGISAVFYAVALATGLRLAGRVEGVHLGATDYADATRLLTASTYLALAALCVSLPAWGQRARSMALVAVSVAALAITFFGFNRHSILALAAASLFVAALERAVTPRILKRAAALAVGAALVLGLGAALDAPGVGFITNQLGAYEGRVLVGLSDSNRGREHVRRTENRHAAAAFRSSPLIGYGFGRPYRPVMSRRYETFSTGDGTRYVHNGYWWLLVKGGLITFVTFIAVVAVALWQVIGPAGRRTTLHLGIAAALVGLLATNLVVPAVSDQGSAPVLGGLLGLLLARAPVGASEVVVRRVPATTAR